MGSAAARFTLSAQAAHSVIADGVVVPVFKKADSPDSSKSKGPGRKASLDASQSIIWSDHLSPKLLNELKAIASEEKFDASCGKTLILRASSLNGLKAKRIILLGLGVADKLEPSHFEAAMQRAISTALSIRDAQSVAIGLPVESKKLSTQVALSLAVDAVSQATYKSMEAKDSGNDLKNVILLASGKDLSSQIETANALADARAFVKDLVNHPANLKTTTTLSSRAQEIGKSAGITTTVQSDVKWISKNMPCFYAVARGSVATDPPKFITLHAKPSGKTLKQIAIVGKSVIFDTGGYQVKPGDSMVTMKGDMTGGAVALATMKALAKLKLRHIDVRAYLAATPNKIDSDAMIPDSIVDTTCGKKVEIRHTDAEGRLTLIDAVAKAVENKPDEIMTIATLTGAAMVAVGHCIALMSNDTDFRDRVQAAGQYLGEPIQTLDVLKEDHDNIKSKLDGADLINTSQKRQRGAQTAAAFVMSGAPSEIPFVHMDIAGADMTPDEKATGTSVKTILQYLLNEDERLGKISSSSPRGALTSASSSASVATKLKPVAAVKAKPVAKVALKSKSKSSSASPSSDATQVKRKPGRPPGSGLKTAKAAKVAAKPVKAVAKAVKPAKAPKAKAAVTSKSKTLAQVVAKAVAASTPKKKATTPMAKKAVKTAAVKPVAKRGRPRKNG
jgi:leucyl aminopeptidase